jgi:MerR family transcriptional regulator, light-induced transcriptional regulator
LAAALNISALARRTGIAADTLRKWEQRYAIIRPMRTRGGQRRYTERDVARVEWLRDRLADGYRISEAAALLGQTTEPAGRTTAESRLQILQAVERGDARELGQLLDQAFALHGVEDVLTAVVAPLLDELGEAWEKGRVGVAEEHLASEAIRARLVQQLADSRAPIRGVAVLACAPGERHDLGLLMLAILLRADGWHIAYLGADTPLEDAFSLARRLGARILCLSLAMAERARGIEEELRARPASPTPVAVGGRGADAMLAKRIGATHVDGDLCRSVRSLRRFSL